MGLFKRKKPEPPPDRIIKEGEQPEKLEPQKPKEPKKPRKWDGWLSVAFISICILMVLIFGNTDFDLNARVAGGLIPVGLCYYTYYLTWATRKRKKKYNNDIYEYDREVREYQRLTSRTRYRKAARSKAAKEVDRIVEENLRRETRAWDTRDFEDLLTSPGRARVVKRYMR
jgi:hypothetical protein